jgi:hypothetical protein
MNVRLCAYVISSQQLAEELSAIRGRVLSQQVVSGFDRCHRGLPLFHPDDASQNGYANADTRFRKSNQENREWSSLDAAKSSQKTAWCCAVCSASLTMQTGDSVLYTRKISATQLTEGRWNSAKNL